MLAESQPQELPLNFLNDFQSLMFPSTASKSDRLRWFTQGIHTAQMKNDDTKNKMLCHTWGLVQSNGGPCGVLAVCAGEMIRILGIYEDFNRKISREEAEGALCETLGVLLARASMASPLAGPNDSSTARHQKCVSLVLPKSNDSISMADLNGCEGNAKFNVVNIMSNTPQSNNDHSISEHLLAKATAKYLSENSRIERFQEESGVILFLLSLVMTRGIDCIRSDMDDPQNSHLTAQFAHSSQELTNLLLTGQATSNAFDGSVTLGGGISCHGPQTRSSIGYLSQLEVLRYCSVGSFFKSPKYPIWIVGSTSHFTVLFGPQHCLEESQSDMLLEKCRRAFKGVESAEDSGYITVESLDNVMQTLDLDLGTGLSTLKAAIEISGAGIILWNDFWRTTSCLMTGATLQSVLDQNMKHNSCTTAEVAPVISGESGQTSGASAVESDEALARRLAEEWGTTQQYTSKSDEEIARDLQVQFQSEGNGNITSTENDVQMIDTSQDNDVPSNSDNILIQSHTKESQGDAETNMGSSFPMFHYNTLRSGELTMFKVTRQSSLEAVGRSIPLSSTDIGSTDDNDLAAVVRTKYNSCKCYWEGEQPPSLH